MEHLFAKFAKTSDEGIREELIRGHVSLAEKVARNFIASGEPYEDIAQEAYIGLVKAVDSFDPSVGVKFSTYATHKISGQIRHYLRDRTSVIRQPGWLHERSRKIARCSEQLRQKLNREPTVSEIAAEAGLAERDVQEVERTRGIFRVGSLDTPEGGGEESSGEAMLDRKRIQSLRAEQTELPVEEKLVLREAVKKLKRMERWVVYALYYQGLSQTEVANQLNISCNYVSHILRGALNRLRQIMASDDVKESHLRAKTGARITDIDHAEGPIDSLTKLFSSTRLRERLEEEVLRASRYGYEIAIVALDIDKLGELNDIHGFAMGDRLLAETANVLMQVLRKSDIASRYTGGTFVLMLPHTGEKGKLGVGQRLVRAVSSMEIRTRTGSVSPTASVGVAVYPLDGDEKDELIDAALTAMRRAKLAGGNRVVVSRDAA